MNETVALAVVLLAVAIFQFWNVYRTARKKYFVYLARVRVSSQYFPVFDCISYSCARKRSWLSLWLGLAVSIVQQCKNETVALAVVMLAVAIFKF